MYISANWAYSFEQSTNNQPLNLRSRRLGNLACTPCLMEMIFTEEEQMGSKIEEATSQRRGISQKQLEEQTCSTKEEIKYEIKPCKNKMLSYI